MPSERGDADASVGWPDRAAVLRPAGELAPRAGRRRQVAVHGVDERLRPLVEQAVDDLAGRLGVDTGSVTVEAAGSVTWSDGSCGCPEPGRAYAQVPVDGAYLRLSHGDRTFHYHHGGRRGLFLCEP